MVIHERWLRKRYPEIKPKDFYRFIFPAGSFETKGEQVQGRYNGIINAVTGRIGDQGKPITEHYVITDELDAVDRATDSDYFCICSPISYIGKKRRAVNARYLYGFVFDVDALKIKNGKPIGLEELIDQTQRKMWAISTHNYLPVPTFIVSSGSGVHLYYVLDKPIPLYPEYVKELQTFKRELERLILNPKVTNIDKIAHQGIFQGFRVPGTITKAGGRATAFLTGDKFSMDELNQYVAPKYQAVNAAAMTYARGGVSLSEAAGKWPEWYERRIKNKEPRGIWHTGRALYDWWLQRVAHEAQEGHRYFCVMTLAIYALKCSHYDAKHNPNPVTYEELERDAYGILKRLDMLTTNEKNHFTTADIQKALEAFQDCFTTYPRKTIEDLTGLEIPANIRKGKKQADHLEEARAIRDVRAERRGVRWDANNGRKSAAGTVAAWRQEHQDGSKADCIEETGLARSTVFKYWNGAPEQIRHAGSDGNKTGRTLEQITQSAKKHIENLRETLRAQESEAEDMRLAIQMLPDGSAKEYIRNVLRETEESIAATKKALDESTNGGGGDAD